MRKLSDITRILNVREVDGNPNVSNVYTIVVSNGSLTDNGGGQVTINTGGGGGGSLTVQEIDGTPNVGSVSTIRVSNGTLTDDGGGQVTINTTGGGSYTDEQAQDAVGTILTDTFDSSEGNYHPIILAQNEGIVCRATVPATGTWQFGMSINWTEIPASAFD